jgi:diguanylate cyclase (GGDEF)-like protein
VEKNQERKVGGSGRRALFWVTTGLGACVLGFSAYQHGYTVILFALAGLMIAYYAYRANHGRAEVHSLRLQTDRMYIQTVEALSAATDKRDSGKTSEVPDDNIQDRSGEDFDPSVFAKFGEIVEELEAEGEDPEESPTEVETLPLAETPPPEHTPDPEYPDPIAGLANTQYLRQFLGQELARSQRHGYSLTVLDLQIEMHDADSAAQPEEDLLLKMRCETAAVLQVVLRSSDLVAMSEEGGFLIILVQISPEEAEGLKSRILREVTDRVAAVTGHQSTYPSVSVGCACFPEHGDTVDLLLSSAEANRLLDRLFV